MKLLTNIICALTRHRENQQTNTEWFPGAPVVTCRCGKHGHVHNTWGPELERLFPGLFLIEHR